MNINLDNIPTRITAVSIGFLLLILISLGKQLTSSTTTYLVIPYYNLTFKEICEMASLHRQKEWTRFNYLYCSPRRSPEQTLASVLISMSKSRIHAIVPDSEIFHDEKLLGIVIQKRHDFFSTPFDEKQVSEISNILNRAHNTLLTEIEYQLSGTLRVFPSQYQQFFTLKRPNLKTRIEKSNPPKRHLIISSIALLLAFYCLSILYIVLYQRLDDH